MVDGVDGAHVIAMAVLFLAAIGEADAERSAEQRRFDIVHAERVAGEHGLHEAAADQRRQTRDAAGVDHHRPGDHDHFLFLLDGLAYQRGRLPDGGFHLPLGRDAVRHEGEGQAVALFGFGRHADAAQPGDDAVARAQIAQTAAGGAAFGDYDHGVHALVFGFDPLAAVSHEGAMVGGGIEILRRAAVALHFAEDGVAAHRPGRSRTREGLQQALHGGFLRRFHFQTQVGGIAIGASNAELLHFEAATVFHDLVEDVLHDVGVDQVAFGFDHFLKWHRNPIVAGG